MNKLKRPIYKYIEAELSDYHKTQRELREAIDDLLNETPAHDNNGGHSYDISDPTYKRTVALVSNVRIRRMEKTIAAIERVYEQLDDSKKKLIHLRYWQHNLTDPGVICALSCGRATYYRWKDNIIFRIARELGY